MHESLPDPRDSSQRPELQQPDSNRLPWRTLDLVGFGIFFGLTMLFLPLGVLQVMRLYRPGFRLQDLSAVEQIVLQGLMDLVLVGFIVFMVKVLHGRSFRETIHWYREHPFGTGMLVSLGATLAVTVAVISSLFPPTETPAIEKFITSVHSLYIFAFFGIIVAPMFEEIIFRGFLFKVFFELAGPGLAVIMTAGLFALLHVPQLWPSWAGILAIFVVGYVLGMVRQRSSSLIPSLIVHTAYNGMLFAMYAVSTFVQKGTSPS